MVDLTRDFESKLLMPFYNRVAKAIRSVTHYGIIFMEGNYFGNMGVPSGISPIEINGVREKLQAFAPHIYDLVIDTPYITTHSSEKRVKVILEHRRNTQERLNVPVIVGEWGAFSSHTKIEKHCNFLLDYFDRFKWSWTYWAWEPEFSNTEASKLSARPYPVAVTGRLISFRYDTVNNTFAMEWISKGTSKAPTVVCLPKEISWSNIEISPSSSYEIIEEEAVYVKIKPRHSGKHTLTIVWAQ